MMHQLRPGPGNLRPFESKTFDGRMLHKVEEERQQILASGFHFKPHKASMAFLRLIRVPSS